MQNTTPGTFPTWLSLTITNTCNLRCKMCGQWGVEGYMKGEDWDEVELPVEVWLKMIDEIPADQFPIILVRGGEPFRYPGIIELLTALRKRNLYVTIDTNGTLLEKFADDIVQAGVNNLTISLDGPEEIHDQVRGVKGTFKKIRNGVEAIYKAREEQNSEITVGLNCTISDHNYMGLGDMPAAARTLNVPSMSTVPYYYFDGAVGAAYEIFMTERLDSPADSWKGFYRETSGVDTGELVKQMRKMHEQLGEISISKYMDLTENEYVTWFSDCTTEVGDFRCLMPWKLLDIQPNGDVNFCIDFPDYLIGNINDQSLEEIWHCDRANWFRQVLQDELLPICARCGAKYMSNI